MVRYPEGVDDQLRDVCGEIRPQDGGPAVNTLPLGAALLYPIHLTRSDYPLTIHEGLQPQISSSDATLQQM